MFASFSLLLLRSIPLKRTANTIVSEAYLECFAKHECTRMRTENWPFAERCNNCYYYWSWTMLKLLPNKFLPEFPLIFLRFLPCLCLNHCSFRNRVPNKQETKKKTQKNCIKMQVLFASRQRKSLFICALPAHSIWSLNEFLPRTQRIIKNFTPHS